MSHSRPSHQLFLLRESSRIQHFPNNTEPRNGSHPEPASRDPIQGQLLHQAPWLMYFQRLRKYFNFPFFWIQKKEVNIYNNESSQSYSHLSSRTVTWLLICFWRKEPTNTALPQPLPLEACLHLTADGCHPDATLFTLFLLLFPCPSPRALDQGPEESGCDYSSVPLPRSPVGALGGAARSPSWSQSRVKH